MRAKKKEKHLEHLRTHCQISQCPNVAVSPGTPFFPPDLQGVGIISSEVTKAASPFRTDLEEVYEADWPTYQTLERAEPEEAREALRGDPKGTASTCLSQSSLTLRFDEDRALAASTSASSRRTWPTESFDQSSYGGGSGRSAGSTSTAGLQFP